MSLFPCGFTVPEEPSIPLSTATRNSYILFPYHAASDTLSELVADNKYLGTDIGYLYLHTWGSTMNFHPHPCDCSWRADGKNH